MTRQQQQRRRRRQWSTHSDDRLLSIILSCAILFSTITNYLHHKITGGDYINLQSKIKFDIRSTFFQRQRQRQRQPRQTTKGEPESFERTNDSGRRKQKSSSSDHSPPTTASSLLSCERFGGPSDELAEGMVYWSDIPNDAHFKSPYFEENEIEGVERFLTFEPDGGGWNNIRMAMETFVVMAHAMGRTLVLPPAQGIYLLRQRQNHQKYHFSFADFFPLDAISATHAGLNIISTEEFLKRFSLSGIIRNTTTNEPLFPPSNRTDWNGRDTTPLKEYLRSAAATPIWRPKDCLAAFPSPVVFEREEDVEGTMGGRNESASLLAHLDEALTVTNNTPPTTDDENHHFDPTPVDAPPSDRLVDNLNGRTRFCLYDDGRQKTPVLHFMCYHKIKMRIMSHFYTFLFFDDWHDDLWAKRFVRDKLRYVDEIQCAAARIVNELNELGRRKMSAGNRTNAAGGGGDGVGYYDAFHVRRGDFQYKRTRVDADTLYENSRDELTDGSGVLYVATDERDKTFFDPLRKHYDVYFLDDFSRLLDGFNTNFYGMVDQLVASRSRVFFGTWHSTFTGYINRIRGYHVQKRKWKGYYEHGTMRSYYFVPVAKKYVMTRYEPVRGAFYNREWPVAWRDIDRDVEGGCEE